MRYLRYLVDRIYYRFNPSALYVDILDALGIDKAAYYALLTLPDERSRYRAVMRIAMNEVDHAGRRGELVTPQGLMLGAALLNLAIDLGYTGKSDD